MSLDQHEKDVVDRIKNMFHIGGLAHDLITPTGTTGAYGVHGPEGDLETLTLIIKPFDSVRASELARRIYEITGTRVSISVDHEAYSGISRVLITFDRESNSLGIVTKIQRRRCACVAPDIAIVTIVLMFLVMGFFYVAFG